jgi:hypothetical protein
MKKAAVIKIFLPVLVASAWFSSVTVFSGCANIVPPSGGPRDSLPPKLVKVTPADSTVNFTGNRISFSFDEYIEVQNIQTNLIVSPVPASAPVVDYRLNTMTVKFRENPEPNTTYTLHFGNAVRDYNEGNVLYGFNYVFATGAVIDSLQLKGKVLLAENGKIDSTLIVMLHTDGDDSSVVKNRPRYFTKLDGSGNFVFRNLPHDTFYIYALQDQGGSLRYLDSKQLFAFADSAIVVRENTAPVTLYAYAEKQVAAPALPGIRPRAGGAADRRLRYQTTLTDGKQNILEKFSFIFEQPLKNFDTSAIRFTVDSTFHPVSDYSWETDSAGKTVRLNFNWADNTLYHFILKKNFAEDSSGRTLLKDDTLTFRTKKRSEYGSLKILFRNLDLTAHPLLQMLQGNEIKKSIPLVAPELYLELFVPGEYDLRLLNDTNKNGKWDPGEFFGKRQQPEMARPIDRKINVRAGIENEFEIVL